MRIPGRRKAGIFRRWLTSRFRARALVLGYHRIEEPRRDPFDLAVSAEVLRRQLEHLRRRAHVVRLADVAAGLATGTVRQRSVALTFDDAYATSMSALREMLEEMELPATVFVPTGLLGREPWWDRLERITARSGRPPERISAGDASIRPRAGPQDTILGSIYDQLRLLEDGPREELLAALDETWPDDGSEARPVHRVVTEDELAALATSGLIDIGSHAHSHPFLASLPVVRQRAEVETSKLALEALIGSRVDLFSYPNGSCAPVTLGLVRDVGYVAACASHPGAVTKQSDRYRIPRFWPGDRESDVARTMALWLG